MMAARCSWAPAWLLAVALAAACSEPQPPRKDAPPSTPPSTPMVLLAGQSNMEGNVDGALFATLLTELGRGSDDDLPLRLSAALEAWYFAIDGSYLYTPELAELETTALILLRDQGLLGRDVTEPLPDVLCSFNRAPVAPLALNCGYPFGPELMLGHAWAASGNPTTSLVKVAKGGTTLSTDWRSPSSGGEVGPEYLKLQEKIGSLGEDPASVNPICAEQDCRWAAFIWFQGENDSFDERDSSTYEANLRNLLADVRGEVGDPALPVIVVQIGAWAQSLGFGPGVASAQQRVVDEDPHARLVATDDLSGYYHYDPAAQLIIGKRIADEVQAVLGFEDAPAP